MKSNWIWINNDRDLKDQTVYFRKEINADKPLKKLKINISLSDKYKLFVNGVYIGIGPSPATPEYFYYDTYNVDERILANTKDVCIAVVGYNIGAATEIVTNRNQGIPAFNAECEVIFDDDKEIYVTDDTWKTIYSPGHYRDTFKMDESRISLWGGFKEVFVSSYEPLGWKECGYDDNTWQNAVKVEDVDRNFINLIPREIPFLHSEIIYPEKIVQIEKYNGNIQNPDKIINNDDDCMIVDASIPGSFPSVVIDFGKEVVGYLKIELKGSKDSNMSIWYGESLDLMRVDTLILNGEWQIYEPFNRRAFRYIKLVFNNSVDIINVKNVRMRLTHYNYNDVGKFQSNDTLLDNIYNVSKYTVKLGSQEHYEDSIWREEMQWLADARVMSLVNYWTFGDDKLPAKAIKQFFRIQTEDGSIPASGPQNMGGYNADFCMHFIDMIYEYYFYTGNTEIISEYYNQICGLMKRFEMMEDNDGLLKNDGKMGQFIDWANLDKREKITAINCYYYRTINTFIKLSSLLGHNDLGELKLKAEVLKKTIWDKLFNKDNKLFTDCLVDNKKSHHYSQQSNLFAIYSGIVDEDDIPGFINRMYTDESLETIKGAFLLSFAVDILFQYNMNERAMFILKDFWGAMIKRGATTWWETFDRTTPYSSIPYMFTRNTPTYLTEYIPVSHCHGWGAGPAYILPKYILGIKSLKPGFKEIEFSPYTKGIKECSGVIPTPYGNIEVQWNIDNNNELKYNIKKPDEITLINVINKKH